MCSTAFGYFSKLRLSSLSLSVSEYLSVFCIAELKKHRLSGSHKKLTSFPSSPLPFLENTSSNFMDNHGMLLKLCLKETAKWLTSVHQKTHFSNSDIKFHL